MRVKKYLFYLVPSFFASYSYADGQLTTETKNQDSIEQQYQSDQYISPSGYTQNPYIGMPSGGGTKNTSESDYANDSVAAKLFNDGTWNVWGGASWVDQNGANNYGYAANIFGQTGQVAGFSLGGLFTAANPFFSKQMNPANPEDQAGGLPVAQQVTPQELYAEYQFGNMVQVDAGWIGISNSPWMTYYQNNALNVVTYQGVLANVNPGGGWLLTGFAINGAQLLGENGFSGQTMYNTGFDNGTGTGNVGAHGSAGTFALGATWNNLANDLQVRIWGYQFLDYADMAYVDGSYKLPINEDMGFTFGVQGLMQGQNGRGDILNSNGYGNDVRSNMVGAQVEFNYKIFGLQLGYNNIWGPSDGYEAGGIVSPYTYQYATDPLYTTGWIQGMVERSSGQAYKVAPSLTLLGENLIITPSYQHYQTTYVPTSDEYDLQISYNVPEVKGLTFFGGVGLLTNADEDGNNVYQAQVMASYLY